MKTHHRCHAAYTLPQTWNSSRLRVKPTKLRVTGVTFVSAGARTQRISRCTCVTPLPCPHPRPHLRRSATIPQTGANREHDAKDTAPFQDSPAPAGTAPATLPCLPTLFSSKDGPRLGSGARRARTCTTELRAPPNGNNN